MFSWEGRDNRLEMFPNYQRYWRLDEATISKRSGETTLQWAYPCKSRASDARRPRNGPTSKHFHLVSSSSHPANEMRMRCRNDLAFAIHSPDFSEKGPCRKTAMPILMVSASLRLRSRTAHADGKVGGPGRIRPTRCAGRDAFPPRS
jgi:hypothetical protein